MTDRSSVLAVLAVAVTALLSAYQAGAQTVPPASPAPLRDDGRLLATITSTAETVPVAPADLIVTFTLENRTDTPVRIWKRWNSWGAYCWSFEVRASDGTVRQLTNPQHAWTVNYPDPVDIPPHGVYAQSFRPFDKSQWVIAGARFPEPPLSPSDFPGGTITLVGEFRLERDRDAERNAPLSNTYFDERDRAKIAASARPTWEGDIRTASITVHLAP